MAGQSGAAVVAEMTVPIRGDLSPLYADLASARAALDAFNSSVASASAKTSSSSANDNTANSPNPAATNEANKLSAALSAANDNAQALSLSFTTMAGAASGSLTGTWQGITQLSTAASDASVSVNALAMSMEAAAVEDIALTAASANTSTSINALADSMEAAAIADINLGAAAEGAVGGLTGVGGAASGAAGNVDRLGNSANNTVGKAGKLTQAGKSLQGQLGNISAQFNDIAVQLQSGQSPFTIALQQGTQLNQVFAGMSGKAVLSGITEAFTSMINPISAATIGIIALGGYAVEYLSKWLGSVDQMNGTLEDQQKLIRSVADVWGNAVPSLRAYVDQLDRAKDVGDGLQAAQDFAKISFAPVADQVATLNVQFAGLVDMMSSAGDAAAPALAKLQSDWQKINDATKQGRTDQQALIDFQTDLAAAFDQTGLPAIARFQAGFLGMVSQIKTAAAQATKATNEMLTALAGGSSVQNIISGSTYRDENGNVKQTPHPGEGNMVGAGGLYVPIPKPEDRPNPESFAPPKTPKIPKSAGEKTAEKQAKQYQDLVTYANQYTESQQTLATQLGMTDAAAAKLTAEQDLFQKAQKEGLNLTDEQKANLKALADQMADAKVKTKNLTDAFNEGKQLSESFFTSLGESLQNGASLWQSFGSAATTVLSSIANKLLTMAGDSIWNSIWNGGLSAAIGGLTGSVTLPTGSNIPIPTSRPPRFAVGTSYAPGGWAIVGENGPERMKVPGGSQIIPNNRINVPQSGSFGGGQTVQQGDVNVYVSGATGNAEVKKMVSDGVTQGLSTYDKNTLSQSVKRVTKKPRMRGNHA